MAYVRDPVSSLMRRIVRRRPPSAPRPSRRPRPRNRRQSCRCRPRACPG